ncbi:integrator complex subunit 11 [Dendrobium catenatum]|uniref:Integrator complex subunit 11 n=1 Tax=Dendrobium catenatum TaxID=906689 RepID=A0A2I0VDB5_9ASPA|nr:integrator complex subunit 11 [Dendrobium catenatum]
MSDFMAANDLIDPGFSGPAFTWTNNKDAGSRISSRLDRFLISSSILDAFQELRVSHLTRIASDHCPILCTVSPGRHRARSYWIKFEDIWASFPRVWQLVSEKWRVPDTGSEASKLNKKCQRTLKALFFWSKNKFKMLNKLHDELDKEICVLQEVQAESLLYKVQLLNSTLGQLSTWWRQRAKVKWIEEGDDNTRFFHSMASTRRRSNLIDHMKLPDGQMVSDQAVIMQVVRDFFETKWRGTPICEDEWPSFEAQSTMLAPVATLLDCAVTEEEIWNGVRGLGQNRAPGRDGVTASFFKSFWSIVGKQVTAACLEFFATGCMNPNWKETVVVLIPKTSNPDRPSMYRPISLCQTIYKIVAKVLVNRMQGFLPNLISGEQAAFVPGRSISDHCLLGQEVLNKFRISKSNPGWMAVKVDMEQAYDKMSWRTLELVLSRMGFPPKFRSWIMSCICSPRFSVMVNGQLTEAITAECGFRQGCPQSPYLFILCSELLSLQFHQRFPEMGV